MSGGASHLARHVDPALSDHPRSSAARTAVRSLVVLLLSGALAIIASEHAQAQSVWELSPYKVRVFIQSAPHPSISPTLEQELADSIVSQARLTVGPRWDLDVEVGQPPLAPPVAEGGFADPKSLPESWLELDKAFVLRLSADPGLAVEAREFDCRALSWGASQSRECPQRQMLNDAVFDAMLAAFRPLGAIEKVEEKMATIRLRAAGLPAPDPTALEVLPESLFVPVLRFNDRDGKPRRTQAIEWTLLATESVAGSEARCLIHTGLRSPLTSRRRGRMEQLALAIIPSKGTTQLKVISKATPPRPLEGYSIYSYTPKSPAAQLLGYTDRDGLATIARGSDPFRLLLIKNGDEVLARLPIVPGLTPQAEAMLPDDDERLAVEGFVAGVQESIVDAVARREVLLLRARKRLNENKLDEAAALVAEVRRLPSRERYLSLLDERRKRVATTDPRLRRQIDKLFADTRKVLGLYLNPQPVDKLEAELNAIRVGAAEGTAATPAG